MRREFFIYQLVAWLLFALLVRAAMYWSVHFAWLLLYPLIVFVHGRRRRTRGKSSLSPLAGPPAVALVWLRVFLRYRLGIGRQRRIDVSQPRGFCPKCGYPMNPGRCPECGTEVAPEKLPRRKVREYYEHKGKIAAIVLVPLLFFGAHHAYYHLDWCSRLSGIWLLRLQARGVAQADAELKRRYRAGALSQEWKQQLFDQATRASVEGKARYPAGVDYFAHVYVHSALADLLPNCRFYLRHHTILVDGRELTEHAETRDVASDDPKRGHWIVGSHAFEPGEHEFAVRGVVTISSADRLDMIDTLAIHTGPFTASTRVMIEDRPPGEFVNPIDDAKSGRKLDNYLTLSGGYPLDDFNSPANTRERFPWMYLRSVAIRYKSGGPAPLAGYMFVRPSDESEFEKFGHIFMQPGKTRYWALPQTDRFTNVQSVDVRIEPDPILALQSTSPADNRYYAAVIERRGVAVKQDFANPLARFLANQGKRK